MKKLIVLLLLVSQNILAQNMNEFRLKTGQSFVFDNVLFENRDTLFIKIEGYEGVYKLAYQDLGYVADTGKLAVRVRHFNEKKNAWIGINLSRLGAVALAPVSMTVALVTIVGQSALTWPKIYTSLTIGSIPSIAILIAVQVKAHDYRAFKKAKSIRRLT